MLHLHRVKQLEDVLRLRPGRLEEILVDTGDCYEQFVVLDPSQPERQREVLNVKNPIHELQTRLYRRVLRRYLKPSPWSHGGVRKRNVLTNAKEHQGSSYLLKADISDFYPSIKSKRVYRLFNERFACPADVARLCTKLTTYQYHLALGLVTSSILADQVLTPVDQRIAGMCEKVGLNYSRFVDDVTISGNRDLAESDIPARLLTIFKEHGFKLNRDKWVSGKTEDVAIAGVRIGSDGFDAVGEYVDNLDRQIADLRLLEQGEPIEGPFITQSQLYGRINYIRWINRERGDALRAKSRGLHWGKIKFYAEKHGLASAKKRLVRKQDEKSG